MVLLLTTVRKSAESKFEPIFNANIEFPANKAVTTAPVDHMSAANAF